MRKILLISVLFLSTFCFGVEPFFVCDKHSKCVYVSEAGGAFTLLLSDEVSFAKVKELLLGVHLGDYGILYVCKSMEAKDLLDDALKDLTGCSIRQGVELLIPEELLLEGLKDASLDFY